MDKLLPVLQIIHGVSLYIISFLLKCNENFEPKLLQIGSLFIGTILIISAILTLGKKIETSVNIFVVMTCLTLMLLLSLFNYKGCGKDSYWVIFENVKIIILIIVIITIQNYLT